MLQSWKIILDLTKYQEFLGINSNMKKFRKLWRQEIIKELTLKLQLVIFEILAYEVCQKPCHEVEFKMSRDTFHTTSRSPESVLIISFDRKWVFEQVIIGQFVEFCIIPTIF